MMRVSVHDHEKSSQDLIQHTSSRARSVDRFPHCVTMQCHKWCPYTLYVTLNEVASCRDAVSGSAARCEVGYAAQLNNTRLV